MFTLYIAQSLDGYIAGPNDETPWSDKEWELFIHEVNKYDALVIGRRTFEIMMSGSEFENIRIPVIYVLTSKPGTIPRRLNNLVVIPFSDFKNLSSNTNYIIAGGAKTAEYFLHKNLVNKLILDIEFITLGSGINIDWGSIKGLKLEHIKTINYSPYGVQVRFKLG